MVGRVLVVVAAWFAAGALLMVEQRRDARATARTGWRKYAVYLAIVVGLLALADAGPVPFAAAIGILLTAALAEFYRAAPLPRWTAVPLVLTGLLVALAGLGGGAPMLYAAAVAVSLAVLAAGALARRPETGAVHAAWAVTGVLAFATPGAHLLLLAGDADRFQLFAFLFVVVAAGDAFAELAGRRWPAGRGIVPVSPGKTASGLAVGALAAVLVACTLGFLRPGWTLPQVAAVALVLAAAGDLGDLIASSMKRAFGIKDFGTWLPGQGGALDRFDSLLFAAVPFYWLTHGW